MGGVTGIGSTAGAFSNPALLSILLPNFNAQAYQQALEVPVTLAEAQLNQLSAQDKVLGTQVSAWQTIQNDLQAIETAAQALEQSPPNDGQPVYGQVSVASSDATQVTASAAAGATGSPGTYVIGPATGNAGVVLAQNEIVNSATQSSDSTALNQSGSFTINGVAIDVSSTDTLQNVASAINAAGAGVTASVMAPPGGGYVLSIQGEKAGAITFTDPNGILGSLGVMVSGSPNIVQNYQYAQYAVNGVQVTQGTSNRDSTTIPGVSFTLLGTTGATLTVTQDQSAVTSGVQSLVSAVNQFLTDAQTLGGKGGTLEGSATLLGAVSQVEQAFGSFLSGQPSGYQSGSQVGLTLSAPVGSPDNLAAALNTTTFTQALSSNPGAVEDLLGGSGGIATTLADVATAYVGATGSLQGKIQGLQQQQQQVEQQITDPLSPANQAVVFAQQQAQTDFTALVQALLSQQSSTGLLSGLVAQLQGSSGSTGGGSSGSSTVG